MTDRYPWGIHSLSSMIGSKTVQTPIETYGHVRAVPSPFHAGLFGRLRAAWYIVTGKAYAVRWPEAGDLEKALDQ